MKPINLLYYAVALFLPIIIAVGITDNTNETHPIFYWIGIPLLFFIAASLSVRDLPKTKGPKQWIIWSTIVGVIEAAILILAV